MKTANKLKVVETHHQTDLMTVEQALAAVKQAELATYQAAGKVNAATNLWPAPMNIRRLIEERRVISPTVAYADHNGRNDRHVERERYASFDVAVAAEVKADNDLAAAKAALAEVERIAFGDGRKVLADAITARSSAKAAAAAARAAAERARAEVRQAESRLGDAEAGIEEARAAHIRFMESSTNEITGGTREDVRSARREHVDAMDDVEMARQAFDTLKAAADEATEDERRSEQKVETAARNVMAVSVPRYMAELDELTHSYKCKAFAAAYYVAAAAPTSFQFGSPEADLRRKADSFVTELARFGRPIEVGTNPHPTGNELFAQTLAALMVDASTPLPEMPS